MIPRSHRTRWYLVRWYLVLASMTGLWLACGGLSWADEPPQVPLGTDNVSAIHGHSKVAIAEFGVEFYTQVYAYDLTTGGNFGTSKSLLTARLAGVGDAEMQAITDQAYADTVAALKAAGFEVVDPAVLAAQADWQPLERRYGLPSPALFSDASLFDKNPSISRVFAPAGRKAFLSSSTGRGDFSQRTAAQNAGRGLEEVKVAQALGADLLHIHFLAGFGVTSKPKRGLARGLSFSNVGIVTAPVLLPNETEIQITSASGMRYFTTSQRTRFNGAVYLDDPVLGEPTVFTLTDTTPAEQKSSDALGNVIGILTHTGTQKTKEFTVTADSAEHYRASYSALLSGVAQAFVNALGAAR